MLETSSDLEALLHGNQYSHPLGESLLIGMENRLASYPPEAADRNLRLFRLVVSFKDVAIGLRMVEHQLCHAGGKVSPTPHHYSPMNPRS